MNQTAEPVSRISTDKEAVLAGQKNSLRTIEARQCSDILGLSDSEVTLPAFLRIDNNWINV